MWYQLATVLVESIYAFDYHVERTDSFRQATDVLVEGYKGECAIAH
jgi:hypothetical protein